MNKNLLIKLYIQKKKSICSIAKLLKVSHSTIHRKMIKYNIPRRTNWKHMVGKKRPKFAKKLSNLMKGQKYTQQRKKNISKGVKRFFKNNSDKIRKGPKNGCWGKKFPEHSKRMKGNKNPAWNGGSSFEPYPLGWNKTFKEQIRYRDGYKCQLCGCPEIESGRRLDIHHIDYNKKNIQPDNLISLCNKCHGKTNSNRLYWIKYFKEEINA